MGRHYTGDINGKFMFGIQSSESADRFGGERCEPATIEYQFEEEHLEGLEKEIKKIEKKLGKKKALIDNYFKKHDGWASEDMEKIGIDEKTDLSEWADLQLGYEIQKKLKEQGTCWFEAEL